VNAPSPPLRLLLGQFATKFVPSFYAERLQARAEWGDVSRAADGD